MKRSFKVLLILLMFFAVPVLADENNLFQADDTLISSNSLSGSAFMAGNEVDLTTNVDGILFAAGNNVGVKSTSDYAFVAGNNITIDNATFKDGFIAGNIIKINSSNIGRDLYVAGSKVTVTSSIGRNITIAAGEVVINGTINGDASVYAETITIDSDAVITGTLKYPEDATINISENANITKKEKTESLSNKSISFNFKSMILGKILSFVNSLFVAVVLLFIASKLFEKMTSLGKDKILSNLGFGLLGFFFLPLLSLMIILTTAGIALGLLMLVLYLVLLYLSTIFSAYYFGNMIFKDKINNKYLIMFVSLLAVEILELIPFVGGIVALVCLFTGFGLFFNILIKRK